MKNSAASKLLITIFSLFFLHTSEISSHKFYVSTSSITYLPKRNTIHITTQIFIDDLELALSQYNKSIVLAPDSNTHLVDSLCLIYFNKHLILKTNNNTLYHEFIGKKYDRDIGIFHLEVNTSSEIPNTLVVNNSVLFDLFDDQKNLIHFKVNQKRKSYLLNRKRPSITISLDEF